MWVTDYSTWDMGERVNPAIFGRYNSYITTLFLIDPVTIRKDVKMILALNLKVNI